MDLSQIDWAQGSQNDKNALILDVRTPEECQEGIIEGAICNNIYAGQAFIYRLDQLDKTKTYYVYCKSGGRSNQACQIMHQMGFEKTYNLVGGILQWKNNIVKM